MTSYDRGDVILADLPFSDLSGVKKRPAVVINAPHPSVDLLALPITSQIENLQPGEFAAVFSPFPSQIGEKAASAEI